MMPRIEAAETLAAINRAALGAGAGDPLERQRIFAALESEAFGPPVPAKADPADLAAMGIGMTSASDQTAIADLDAWLGQGDASNV